MSRAVLSLGSNLGDRLAHLRTAVATLGDAVLLVSGVYETPPWGDEDQPAYLNAVLLAADPTATARDWLDRAHAAERAAGRTRDPARRYGPRTLDVDVVAVWGDDDEPVLSADPELTLPHPRAHLRAFVLRPWIDIQPYGRLPGHGWLTDLLNTGPAAGDALAVRPRPDLGIESTT
ncbi:2-amino-4-hydroxy-6-hydroxymethyldihydropteridine pyrophosphokinase [Micromonospora rosaria]|uniref:2-amino-4-hydroxy-6-hydroxymethyldihydropteridine diphosphokinase n=1 Tax=Micromonospora rosaria TaxID=47874 RepID=A0A136PN49_9ACTN|nr:2-amino-4-hydroxy-6-hydroxymethyldihydropteridine diphosphokinase [Micromonospora rosaria]KXK59853.1 2-amino-4-hydroxy-6-hydroxymethyldihydropteridine pyrophosphokinase [Micromonospora rosaria]